MNRLNPGVWLRAALALALIWLSRVSARLGCLRAAKRLLGASLAVQPFEPAERALARWERKAERRRT